MSGKTTPGYCAELAGSYQAPQGFATFCDSDFDFAFDYPQAWGGLLKVESQQLDPVETNLPVSLKSRTFSTTDGTVLLNGDTFFRSAGEVVNHYWSYPQSVYETSGYGEMLLGGKPAYAIFNPSSCDGCSASVDLNFQHGEYFTVMSFTISDDTDLETFWQIVRSIQVPGKTPRDNRIPDALVQAATVLARTPGAEGLAPDLRIGNGAITALAVSPDGRWLAIGTPFGVHLYNANSFKEAWFVPLAQKTEELAFDRRGKRLGVASGGDVLLFDTARGDLVRILADGGFNFAFSPDGARVVSGAGCHRVTVWDTESGQALKELRGNECSEGYSGIHVAWAADGRIYAAAMGAQIQAWDGASYQPLEDFSAEGASETWVSSLLAAPTGSLLAQYDFMGRPVVAIIDGEKNQQVRLLDQAANGGISALAWAPDGRRLAVAYGMLTGLIQVWDARSGQLERQFEGYPNTVGLGWSADGAVLYGPGTLDGRLHAISVESGRVLLSLAGHIPAQTFLSWTGDGLISTDGVTVTWWDATSGTSLRQENAGSASESVISWPPAGPATFLFNSSGPAHQVGTLSSRQPLEGDGNQYPFSTAWFADGTRLADPSHVWDAGSGRLLATLRDLAQRHVPDRVAWAPDGERLASADSLNMQPPVIWDERNGQVLLSLEAEIDQRTPLWLDLAWSPDGSRLAAVGGLMSAFGDEDGMILLWDASTGQQKLLQTEG
ncbi:WD40 repeat domain-containing protein, partial [bacterium]